MAQQQASTVTVTATRLPPIVEVLDSEIGADFVESEIAEVEVQQPAAETEVQQSAHVLTSPIPPPNAPAASPRRRRRRQEDAQLDFAIAASLSEQQNAPEFIDSEIGEPRTTVVTSNPVSGADTPADFQEVLLGVPLDAVGRNGRALVVVARPVASRRSCFKLCNFGEGYFVFGVAVGMIMISLAAIVALLIQDMHQRPAFQDPATYGSTAATHYDPSQTPS
jgi:hypothetical protein